MKLTSLIILTLLSLCSFGQTIELFSGDTSAGYVDGRLEEARFNSPFGICSDKQGNLYLADTENNVIRKISTDGIVSTIAGTGQSGHKDGRANEAMFNNPTGVACDEHGNLFVAGFEGNRIRKISTDGMVTTIAGNDNYSYKDGVGAKAEFRAPRGVCIDTDGNLFVGDCWNHYIRKINKEGNVSTIAGDGYFEGEDTGRFKDGKSSEASFNAPCGVQIDTDGNIFVADANNHRIRKVSKEGIVTTIAGFGESGIGNGGFKDGGMNESVLNTPTELFVDSDGTIYFSDTYNNCVRMITKDNIVKTLIRDDGTKNILNFPRGITKVGDIIYVVDHGNNCIRKIIR